MIQPIHSSNGPTRHVLVVDDDHLINDSLVRKFLRQGYDVTSAFDGHEALERLNQSPFDAVLLDLLMPIEDGFEVLAKRSSTPNAQTPVFVLTTIGRDDEIARARELGAKQVYFKSETSPKEVVASVCAEVDHG